MGACKSNVIPLVGGLGLSQGKELGRKRVALYGCFVA